MGAYADGEAYCPHQKRIAGTRFTNILLHQFLLPILYSRCLCEYLNVIPSITLSIERKEVFVNPLYLQLGHGPHAEIQTIYILIKFRWTLHSLLFSLLLLLDILILPQYKHPLSTFCAPASALTSPSSQFHETQSPKPPAHMPKNTHCSA